MQAPGHLREQARAIFSGEDKEHPPCQDCGGVHARACPRIRSVHTMINDQGIVVSREVTYWPPGQWEHHCIFWDDINDADD